MEIVVCSQLYIKFERELTYGNLLRRYLKFVGNITPKIREIFEKTEYKLLNGILTPSLVPAYKYRKMLISGMNIKLILGCNSYSKENRSNKINISFRTEEYLDLFDELADNKYLLRVESIGASKSNPYISGTLCTESEAYNKNDSQYNLSFIPPGKFESFCETDNKYFITGQTIDQLITKHHSELIDFIKDKLYEKLMADRKNLKNNRYKEDNMESTAFYHVDDLEDATVLFRKSVTIKDVIFNDNATIVLWNDRTKTVVKMNEDELKFDPEKAIMAAFMKKVLGKFKCPAKERSLDNIFKKYNAKYDNMLIEKLDKAALKRKLNKTSSKRKSKKHNK